MDGPWAWMRLIEKVTVAFGMEWACVLCGRSVSFGMGGMDMIWIWMNLISFVRLTIADIYIYIYACVDGFHCLCWPRPRPSPFKP